MTIGSRDGRLGSSCGLLGRVEIDGGLLESGGGLLLSGARLVRASEVVVGWLKDCLMTTCTTTFEMHVSLEYFVLARYKRERI